MPSPMAEELLLAYHQAGTLFFTIEEKEFICQLDFSPSKKATNEQRRIAALAAKDKKQLCLELAKVFEYGNDHAAKDQWKAHQYRKKAGITTKPPGPEYLNTDSFYKFHAWWFTGIRLFLVRVNRFFVYFGQTFLPAFFSFFGLSYGFSFLFDIAVVLKTTFAPKKTPEEIRQNHSFWKRTWLRFKNVIQKDNRPYRLMNDAVWFLVNLTVLCTAGPLFLLLNPILNLVGFSFDTVHEFFWLGRDTQKYTRLMQKINHQIKHDCQKLASNPEDTALRDNIAKQRLMYDKLKHQRYLVMRRRLWISVCTALVLVGMVLLYFPPTTLPGAFLIGSGIALAAGSLATGLGRRLYLILEEWIKKKKGQQSAKQAPSSTQKLRKSMGPVPGSKTPPIVALDPSPPASPNQHIRNRAAKTSNSKSKSYLSLFKSRRRSKKSKHYPPTVIPLYSA